MHSTPFPYRIIDHTADLGIIVKGSNKKDLFIHAALAMTDLMVRGNKGRKRVERDVIVEGVDFPDLMVR
ncbi:MAG TPA: archease, partial [Desulfatiglandales bacterium]|nr:archease [Desulfatiglandales bacterium]